MHACPRRYASILQTGACAVVLALLVTAGNPPASFIIWPLAEDCPAERTIITPQLCAAAADRLCITGQGVSDERRD